MLEQVAIIISPFLDYLKFEKRYSPHTLTAYQTDLTDFFLFQHTTFDECALKTANHNQIRTWLASLKEKGIAAKTINRKISSLKSFFKYNLKTGVVALSPMGKIISPKVGKRLPVFVKEDDTKQLLTALNAATENWQSLNAKMLITIFYATGMRLSELINLKESQIDAGRHHIKVLGKGNKERILPINKELLAEISNYQQLKRKEFEAPENTLLVTEKGKKLYPRYAWQLVNKHLGQSTTLNKKSPHILRHTFATHLMNNGADLNAVKELLGHSSLASTQVYTHNTIEKLKDIHKKAHPKA